MAQTETLDYRATYPLVVRGREIVRVRVQQGTITVLPGLGFIPISITSVVALTPTSIQISLANAVANNAAIKHTDIYIITPHTPSDDARGQLAVFAVDTGVDTTTQTIVLTIEEMIDGIIYDVDILTMEEP